MMRRKIILFFISLIMFCAVVNSENITKTRTPTIIAEFNESVQIIYFTILRNEIYEYDISMIYDDGSTYKFKPDESLQNGDYTFILQYSDIVGNNASLKKVFKIDVPFAIFELIKPEFYVSPTKDFEIEINSDKPMEQCVFYAMPNRNGDLKSIEEVINTLPSNHIFDTSADGLNHIAVYRYTSEDLPFFLYVLCTDVNGISNENNPEVFELMIDTSLPLINAYSVPERVIETLSVELITESLENSAVPSIQKYDLINCKFDSQKGKSYDSMEYFFNVIESYNLENIITLNTQTNPSISDNNSYEFYVKCKNRAGLVSEEKNITFEVNLNAGNIIVDKGPSGYTNNDNPILFVETNRDSYCSYYKNDDSPMDLSGHYEKYHEVQLSSLSEGEYTYTVNCIFTQGDPIEDTITFIVDKTKPSQPTVEILPVCSQNFFEANFESTDDNGISGFRYKLIDSKKDILFDETVEAENDAAVIEKRNLNLKVGDTYKLEVSAIDIAQNIGNAVSTDLVVLNSSDNIECMEKDPPILKVTLIEEDNNVTVYISCEDQSGCEKVTYSYASFYEDQNCSAHIYSGEYITEYENPFYVTSSGKLCYMGVDVIGNIAKGEKQINFTPEDSNGDSEDYKDTDGDGITDICEEIYGFDPTDSDENSNDVPDGYEDYDNDGLNNMDECKKSTDANDPDTDYDNIKDGGERTSNTDPKDETDTPLDEDSDGIDDEWEDDNCYGDCDPDNDMDEDSVSSLIEYLYNTDPNDPDTDGDGLTDGEEIKTYFTLALKDDTDSDGFSDRIEILAGTSPFDPYDYPEDSDNDGMPDEWEEKYSDCGLDSSEYSDKYMDPDNDGLFNIDEFKMGTDPCVADTDNDGFEDGGEITSNTDPLDPNDYPTDSDLDNMDDDWEIENFSDLSHDGTQDTDGDGLTDYEEYLYNTNPNDPDTDGDGLTDGEEVKNYHTNPLKTDTDVDTYSDFIEIEEGTDPLDPLSYPIFPDTDNNEEDRTEDNKPKKSHLAAIILLIIGFLLILGGAGYLLYKKYYLKNSLSSNQNYGSLNNTDFLAHGGGSGQKKSLLNIFSKQQQTQEQIKKNNALRQRLALQKALLEKKRLKKDKERGKLFSAFDSDEKSEIAIKEKTNDGKIISKKSMHDKKLQQARKVMQKIVKNENEQKNNKKTNDTETMKKLDGIIKKDSVFNKLDKLSSKETPIHIQEKLEQLSRKKSKKTDISKIINKDDSDKNIDDFIEKDKKRKKSIFDILKKIKK